MIDGEYCTFQSIVGACHLLVYLLWFDWFLGCVGYAFWLINGNNRKWNGASVRWNIYIITIYKSMHEIWIKIKSKKLLI